MAIEFLEGGASGTTPARPPSLGPVAQAAPTLNKTAQNFLGIMGAEGYVPPPTPTGPYATAYLSREARKVEMYRATTGRALQTGVPALGYVYTGYSDKATTSYKTVDSLISEFEAMSIKQKKNLAKALAMAGYLGGSGTLEERVEESSLMDVGNAYNTLLQEATQRFAAGQNITIDELLDMNIRYNMAQAGVEAEGDFSVDAAGAWYDAATGKTGKPYKETRVDRSVDIFSPEDARGLARQSLQSVLGRDPSEAEYEDFLAALQTKARQNPTITRTTTRYDAEGNPIGTNSVTRGGLGENAVRDFAQDQAEAAPDWAEWQAVGTYFPAIMESLSSVVPGA